MDGVLDWPYDATIEALKGYMESYGHPALLIDEKGKVLARNSLADKGFIPERVTHVRGLLPAEDLGLLRNLNPGEVRSVQLKTKGAAETIVVRLKYCFFLGWRPARDELSKSVLDANSSVGKGSLSLLNYFAKAEGDSGDGLTSFKRLTEEQLCRQVQLSRMMEIVTNTNVRIPGLFAPYFAAKSVCEIAGKMLEDGDGPALVFSVDYAEECCRGVEEDYCSAVSAMIAFAAKNCTAGFVRADGTLEGRRYVFRVSFKSEIPTENLSGGIRGAEDAKAALSPDAASDLLYIRCLAENGLWGLEARETGGQTTLVLSVPVARTKEAAMLQPASLESVRAIVRVQLAFLYKG